MREKKASQEMGCCVCVEQSEVALVEEWGKFTKQATPGCHCLVPCRDSIAGKLSLRVRDHECVVESKTKDNVFLNVKLNIQYCVLPDSVDKAFYTLQNPIQQIEAYVFNTIRGQIPHFTIDEVFSMRGELATRLKNEVDNQMDQYGYDIVTVLITDIDPARTVKEAMNQIQMYQRLKTATTDKAEAHKLQVVKAAEADAEAKRLSGVGLAEQRKAIVAGLQNSIESFQENVQDLNSEEVMSLLLMNQYFDTLKEVAQNCSASTLFLSHTGGLDVIAQQMQRGVLRKK